MQRLRTLAENAELATLPWVLAALAKLAGLTRAEIAQLETIALADRSMPRRAGAIEMLVQCTELTADWRRTATDRLVDTLARLADGPDPGEDLALGLRALGNLRAGGSDAWDLCARLIRHDDAGIRMSAVFGMSGMAADSDLSARIIGLLDRPETKGEVRGGLVDALHRSSRRGGGTTDRGAVEGQHRYLLELNGFHTPAHAMRSIVSGRIPSSRT